MADLTNGTGGPVIAVIGIDPGVRHTLDRLQEPRSGIIAVGYLVSVGIGDLRGLSGQIVGILSIVVGGIAGDGFISLCQRTKQERFQYHEHESIRVSMN